MFDVADGWKIAVESGDADGAYIIVSPRQAAALLSVRLDTTHVRVERVAIPDRLSSGWLAFCRQRVELGRHQWDQNDL